jgi:hypothetical protein
LDGSELDGGTFDLRLRAELDARWRGPGQLDLRRGFGLELEVDECALRGREGGPVLAGVEQLAVDVRRIAPDSGSVHVRSIQVVRPSGRVAVRADGLHALGLVLKPTAPAAGADGEATPAADAVAPAGGGAARSPAVAADARSTPPELRVDELVVSGLDFELRDEVSDPPCILPLDAFELHVRGLTSRALVEPHPVRFQASLGAAPVELPKRVEAIALPFGFAQAAAAALTGGSDEVGVESRRVLDELAVRGRLRLAPALSGTIDVSLVGLELPAFRGPAAASGVQIGDGLLDAGTSLRFDGGDLDVRTGFTFRHLSLSEEPGGPISTYLRLPAPLDTVLFALRNEAGEHRLSPSFHVAQGSIGGGEIARVAAQTLAEQIASAVAAAPLRVAGTATDLFGLGGDEQLPEPVAAPFAAADPALTPAGRAAVAELAEVLAGDPRLVAVLEHQYGEADLARAMELGNPTPEQVAHLALRLRQRLAELRRQRELAGADARAAVAAAPHAAPAAVEALWQVDRELGCTAAALDEVLALAAPGAERRRTKRALAAAAAFAEARLVEVHEALRRELAARGIADAAARLEVRPPRAAQVAGEGSGRVLATPRLRVVQ